MQDYELKTRDNLSDLGKSLGRDLPACAKKTTQVLRGDHSKDDYLKAIHYFYGDDPMANSRGEFPRRVPKGSSQDGFPRPTSVLQFFGSP